MVDLIPQQIPIILYKTMMIFVLLGNLFVFLTPNAYVKVNKVLMKEYGFKNKIIPWLETEKKTIDVWVLKRRGLFGVLFIGVSVTLLFSVH